MGLNLTRKFHPNSWNLQCNFKRFWHSLDVLNPLGVPDPFYTTKATRWTTIASKIYCFGVLQSSYRIISEVIEEIGWMIKIICMNFWSCSKSLCGFYGVVLNLLLCWQRWTEIAHRSAFVSHSGFPIDLFYWRSRPGRLAFDPISCL